MKRLIRNLLRESLGGVECDCCKYFNLYDLSMYGGIEHPIYYIINKGKVVELEYISPEEYLNNIAKGFGMTYDEVLGSAYNEGLAKRYAADMKSGSKFPVGYYVDGKSNQEGRDRAVAAMMLGCDKIPVVKEVEVDSGYIWDFVDKYKDYSRDELDTLFKDKGYNGISGLDWREFQNYINYRL